MFYASSRCNDIYWGGLSISFDLLYIRLSILVHILSMPSFLYLLKCITGQLTFGLYFDYITHRLPVYRGHQYKVVDDQIWQELRSTMCWRYNIQARTPGGVHVVVFHTVPSRAIQIFRLYLTMKMPTGALPSSFDGHSSRSFWRSVLDVLSLPLFLRLLEP